MKNNQVKLTKGVLLEHTANHIHIAFDRPTQIVSSAVLNGGTVNANHILNLNIRNQSNSGLNVRQPPNLIRAQYCRKWGWSGTTVGLMTATSKDSVRMVQATEQSVEIFVLVTAGLSKINPS